MFSRYLRLEASKIYISTYPKRRVGNKNTDSFKGIQEGTQERELFSRYLIYHLTVLTGNDMALLVYLHALELGVHTIDFKEVSHLSQRILELQVDSYQAVTVLSQQHLNCKSNSYCNCSYS